MDHVDLGERTATGAFLAANGDEREDPNHTTLEQLLNDWEEDTRSNLPSGPFEPKEAPEGEVPEGETLILSSEDLNGTVSNVVEARTHTTLRLIQKTRRVLAAQTDLIVSAKIGTGLPMRLDGAIKPIMKHGRQWWEINETEFRARIASVQEELLCSDDANRPKEAPTRKVYPMVTYGVLSDRIPYLSHYPEWEFPEEESEM